MLAIFACLYLISCKHPVSHFVIPNFIEIDNVSIRDNHLGDFSVYVFHLPTYKQQESCYSIGVCLSFESDSCFVINEQDICATIGKDTLRHSGWGLLYNRNSTYNGKIFCTPSFFKNTNADNLDTIFFTLAQQLEVPKGKNTLYCLFDGSRFVSPIRINAFLSGLKTSFIAMELKPEKTVVYNQNVRLVKWDEKTIIREKDSLCICLSRQPLKKSNNELICLLYFDTFGKLIINKNKFVGKKKQKNISHFIFNPNYIDLGSRDTSYCVEVLDNIPLSFLKPFGHEKSYISQAHILFKIKRKDGGIFENIPDLFFSPNNILLKDDIPILKDTIEFKGIVSPFIE